MASETFDICSAFPSTRVSQRDAVSTPDGSPIVRAREINERPLRVFTIAYDGPRQALARLKDLWRRLCYGSSQPMTFTPKDEAIIEVRFLPNTLSYKISGATHASFSVELEEIR